LKRLGVSAPLELLEHETFTFDEFLQYIYLVKQAEIETGGPSTLSKRLRGFSVPVQAKSSGTHPVKKSNADTPAAPRPGPSRNSDAAFNASFPFHLSSTTAPSTLSSGPPSASSHSPQPPASPAADVSEPSPWIPVDASAGTAPLLNPNEDLLLSELIPGVRLDRYMFDFQHPSQDNNPSPPPPAYAQRAPRSARVKHVRSTGWQGSPDRGSARPHTVSSSYVDHHSYEGPVKTNPSAHLLWALKHSRAAQPASHQNQPHSNRPELPSELWVYIYIYI